jgi:acetolactate synthase-1/2/3 large subunit
VVGSNGGTLATREIVAAADLVVFVGCRAGSVTTERWRFPVPGKTKIIHIDADPGVVGASYRADVALIGDARLALSALGRALRAIAGARVAGVLGPKALARAKAQKFDAFQKLAQSNERPIRPERLVAAVQAVLPDDAVIVCDPGTPCPYFSAYYTLPRAGRHFISNRAHGALGYAMAAAVGAHIGRPTAKVVAVMGDGSFGFTAGELETIVRHKVPVTMIVVSNAVYGWIKAGQRTGFGGRYYSVDFTRTDHAAVAAAYGVKSWRVEDPAVLQQTLVRAIATDGPTLVDVITQPLDEAAAPVSEWVA